MEKRASKKNRLSGNWDWEADVIVVGYGGAGAVAAITAHDAGAKVLVLEKSPSIASLKLKSDWGRTTQISGGGGNTHIAVGIAASPADAAGAAAYLYAACGGTTPMEVCQAWAEEVCKNEAWFKEMGIKGYMADMPTEYPSLPHAEAMTAFRIMGWGPAFFARLDRHVQDRGIKVLFDTPGVEFIQDGETKEILGVMAENEGKRLAVKARRGVVLCTGGFEFNETMKNRFLKCWPMKFYGWKYNTGDGIRMAQKAGADIWHMDVLAGGNCCWFDDPDYDFGMTVRTRTANFIWVDRFGRRFCNEPAAWHPHGGWVVHLKSGTDSPGFSRVPSYIVFDEAAQRAGPLGADEAVRGGMPMGRRLLPPELGGWEGWSRDNVREIERGWVKRAETIPGLAAAIGGGMDTARLEATIKTYNGYCAAGKDPEFSRAPEKLLPLSTPPYYAVPLYPGLVSTCGGPVRSARGEVLDPDGQPIPRLYTAGSCGSVYGRTYSVTGGNLGELSAFGRISGRNAAALEPWG
jgi:succinate dehydrogenase/fumarate reductase flavoprotein subunit